jgi:hypothetical protein
MDTVPSVENTVLVTEWGREFGEMRGVCHQDGTEAVGCVCARGLGPTKRRWGAGWPELVLGCWHRVCGRFLRVRSSVPSTHGSTIESVATGPKGGTCLTAISPAEFAKKWMGSTRTERAASQEHFIDLCRMLGVPTPNEADPTGDTYAFEKGAGKTEGHEAEGRDMH